MLYQFGSIAVCCVQYALNTLANGWKVNYQRYHKCQLSDLETARAVR